MGTENMNAFQTTVVLPSRGRFYKDNKPVEVTLRPIKVAEEKLLSGRGSRMDMVDKILQRCIISECPPVKELLVTDKYYLLLNLRSISYGAEYKFEMTCPSCDAKYKHSIQLPKGLTLKMADERDVEPFEIELPSSKVKVSLRFMRGEDEDAVVNYVRGLPNGGGQEGDPSYSFRMALLLSKIDGKDRSLLDKISFCEDLIGADSFAIRQAIADREPGLEFKIEAKCPSCQSMVQTQLPLTSEFFPS